MAESRDRPRGAGDGKHVAARLGGIIELPVFVGDVASNDSRLPEWVTRRTQAALVLGVRLKEVPNETSL
jgi:hypothetical protein